MQNTLKNTYILDIRSVFTKHEFLNKCSLNPNKVTPSSLPGDFFFFLVFKILIWLSNFLTVYYYLDKNV